MTRKTTKSSRACCRAFDPTAGRLPGRDCLLPDGAALADVTGLVRFRQGLADDCLSEALAVTLALAVHPDSPLRQ